MNEKGKQQRETVRQEEGRRLEGRERGREKGKEE